MNTPTPFLSSVRRGFTLIELLVVIAIIGVLASLIIVVVPKVTRNARKTQCMSNLRQINYAMSVYTVENKGAYPAVKDATSGQSWWLVIGTYIDRKYSVGNSLQNQLFLCPAAANTFDPVAPRRTYALNSEGTSETMANSVSKNSKPSRTLFVIDGAKEGAGPDSYARFRYSAAPKIDVAADSRHDGRFSALFLDGHVAMLEPTDPALLEYVQNWGK